jgi:hypothetical protein
VSADHPGLELQIRVMQATLEELRESVDYLMRRQLEREDRRAGEALLPIVYELYGEEIVTPELLAMRALNDRTPDGQAMFELIGEYSTDPENLRAFGRFLKRLSGVALAGYRLVPQGELRDGLAWRVVRVSRAKNPRE